VNGIQTAIILDALATSIQNWATLLMSNVIAMNAFAALAPAMNGANVRY
jgi:hypothetical protein